VYLTFLHDSIVLAICVAKTIKFCGDLTKLWQKQVGAFFLAHPVHSQRIVATRVRCGGIFETITINFIALYSRECASKRIVKEGQYLMVYFLSCNFCS